MELFWKSKKWHVFKRSAVFGLASSQNQKMNSSKGKKKNKEKFHFLRSPVFEFTRPKNGLLIKKNPFLQAQKMNLFLVLFFLFLPSCKTKKMDSLKGKTNKRKNKFVLLIFSK
jgi:hypothetical protein